MAKDWKAFISSLEARPEERRFGPPASLGDVGRIEAALCVTLPEDLRSLLLQSDGVEGIYGLGLVWSCARIVNDNVKFRTYPDFRDLYMPFEPLLFFGDAGNGDQFAYTICGGRVRPDICVWNHEDDSRSWKAPNLGRYFEWTFAGKLKV
ncbi:MAG TPA: SMI1/KNR4 family protein [Anaeromyxobacteraceae bacterium]|nr:SMI1/KNR4 family protein [Anaeromyxobacteraceae bacterium]